MNSFLLEHDTDVYGTGADDDVTLFADRVQTDSVPGIPKLNARQIVCGSPSLGIQILSSQS